MTNPFLRTRIFLVILLLVLSGLSTSAFAQANEDPDTDFLKARSFTGVISYTWSCSPSIAGRTCTLDVSEPLPGQERDLWEKFFTEYRGYISGEEIWPLRVSFDTGKLTTGRMREALLTMLKTEWWQRAILKVADPEVAATEKPVLHTIRRKPRG